MLAKLNFIVQNWNLYGFDVNWNCKHLLTIEWSLGQLLLVKLLVEVVQPTICYCWRLFRQQFNCQFHKAFALVNPCPSSASSYQSFEHRLGIAIPSNAPHSDWKITTPGARLSTKSQRQWFGVGFAIGGKAPAKVRGAKSTAGLWREPLISRSLTLAQVKGKEQWTRHATTFVQPVDCRYFLFFHFNFGLPF